MLVLLLSRLVQGLGGGTIGVVQAYVADASTPEERTKSLGWLSAVTSLGAVAGPAFGSVMISLGGRARPASPRRRWRFWSQVSPRASWSNRASSG